MPLQITVEHCITGPLARRHTLRDITAIVTESASLDDCHASLVSAGYGRHLYRGGSHIAFHPTHRGAFVHGERHAIITSSK